MAKMGRPPRIPVTPELKARIDELASIGMKTHDIAVLTGVPETTLEKKFSSILVKRRAEARERLYRTQWDLAMSGSKGAPMMQVWLGKNYGGQTDKADITSAGKALKVIVERIG